MATFSKEHVHIFLKELDVSSSIRIHFYKPTGKTL